MSRRGKKLGNKQTLTWLEIEKRVRKDWGQISPVTKIKKSKKKYNRKKEKKDWNKNIDISV